MLNIDCLLRNTLMADALRSHIRERGVELAKSEKDASFNTIFNEMREAGVEVDAESAAHIYGDELSNTGHDAFTPLEQLHYQTGKWMDNIMHTLAKRPAKKGEKTIGELSPANAAVKTISDIFNNNVVEDHTTKSILKTIEDTYKDILRPMLGELPEGQTEDTRTLGQMVQEALDRKELGIMDKDGVKHTLEDVHEAAKKRIAELTEHLAENGDHDKQSQWENYIKSFREAVTLNIFKSGEGKKILHEALMESNPDYVKITKGGERVINYEKLAGNVNSIAKLRDNVGSALKDKGFSEEQAKTITDALHKEFVDMRGEMMQRSKDKEAARGKTQMANGGNKRPDIDVDKLINDRIKETSNYRGLVEEARAEGMDVSEHAAKLNFSASEMRSMLKEAMIKSGITTTDRKGNQRVDIDKLSKLITDVPDIKRAVRKYLENNGYSKEAQDNVPEVMQHAYNEMFDKVREHVQRKQQFIEDTWNTPTGAQPKLSVGEMVQERIRRFANYRQITNDYTKPLIFKRGDAQRILSDALKNSEQFGKEKLNPNVDNVGHADFGKDKVPTIDWKRLAMDRPDRDQLEQLVKQHLQKEGLSNYDSIATADALSKTYQQLDADITAHGEALLRAREEAIARQTPIETKSNLTRLGELHDLGIFNGSHDALLAHTLGLEADDVVAMAAIKQYAEKLSKLRKVMSGNEWLAANIVHELNRSIHNIIAPVITNKDKLLKNVSALNKIYQVENLLLITTYGNITENHLSGGLELLTTNLSMRLKLGGELGGSKAQDRRLMQDMYVHIGKGGAEFGLAPYQVGGAQERPSDKYTIYNMRGADWSKPGTYGKAIATGALSIGRAGLSGMDGSVKSGLMNAHLKGEVVDALVNSGKYSKDEAVQAYNDAIYGDGQLDRATQRAEDIYKSIGMDYVSKKELNITANEILRENLLNIGSGDPSKQGVMTPETLKDLMDNAYHMAGLGMGHESNNWMSRGIEAQKRYWAQREREALNDNDYRQAARIRLVNTVINGAVMRFASSRMNWSWIRMQQAGGGLLTGLYHYTIANKYDKQYRNSAVMEPEILQKATKEYQMARQGIARGIVGIAASASVYGGMKALAAAMFPNEEDSDEALAKAIRGNYSAYYLLTKVAPIWSLNSFYYNDDTHGNEWTDKALRASLETFTNLTSIGDSHDASVSFNQVVSDLGNKSQKVKEQGEAKLGRLVQNFLPHIPMVRQGKQVAQFVNYLAGKEKPSMPDKPRGWWQGFLYGTVMEDMLETLPDQTLDNMGLYNLEKK